MGILEQSSRIKVRFDSPRGLLSVEDLWDLPLTSGTGDRANLDSVAIDLQRRIRDGAEVVSFVTPTVEDAGRAILQLKFEVAKHVIGARVAERDELRAAADRRDKKQRLPEMIAKKEDAELGEKSVEELRTLAESL